MYWIVKNYKNINHLNFRLDAGLYHHPDYVNFQSENSYYSFLLFYENNNYPCAFIHLTKDKNDYWVSPSCAPFGGLVSNDDCTLQGIQFLFQTVQEWLNLKLCKSFKLKAPSKIYEYNKNYSQYFYILLGFKIQIKDINFHISVDTNSFISIIKPQEKRRLRKCYRNGFVVKHINNTEFPDIYEFIKRNRELKQYNLSVSLEQLAKQLTNFPNHFIILGIFDGDQIVAVSLCVLVTSKVMYNFLVSDCLSYRTFSPIVMLYEALYNYCQANNYRTLDLGVSLDNDGNYKPSLARFKLNMGAETSEKITWIKDI